MLPVAGLIAGLAIGAGAAGSSKKASAEKAAPTVTSTATVSAVKTVSGGTVTARPVITKVVATRTKVRIETYTPPPKPAFGDGTYKVGSDIKPGEYRTSGGGDCYYEVDRNLSGGVDSIVTNDNFDGSAIATVKRGQYLKVDGGCQWRRS